MIIHPQKRVDDFFTEPVQDASGEHTFDTKYGYTVTVV